MLENITKRGLNYIRNIQEITLIFGHIYLFVFFFLRNIIRFICEQGLQDIEYGIISTLDPTKLFHPR